MLELDYELKRQLGMKQCGAWYQAAMYNSVAKRRRATRQGASTASTARTRQATAPVQAKADLIEFKVIGYTPTGRKRERIFKGAIASDATRQARRMGWTDCVPTRAVRVGE